ncbi:MAG TPA: lipase maturation factor family protein [Polyangiales bacterium]|nr:lipase maturation factor family protein [Polyangiales bacterium]
MRRPFALTDGTDSVVATLFVRGLGVVFAIAFASLLVQVVGLFGTHGISPLADHLALARERLGADAALHFPSWLWLCGAGDAALRGACLAGIACSLLVAAGRVPRSALFGAWSLYLSFCSLGQPFLSYQWDLLLLETGLVGMFVATPGSRLGLWLARALCFKLMLLSGIVKLRSGDPTWRDLSAMSYHFWTQPLPAWPAVFAAALPAWTQAALTFATLAIELVAPLASFGPRRARLIAAALLAALQLGIAATGTYGFFNLLSLLLCLALLDDAALPARLRALLEPPRAAPPVVHLARVRLGLHVALASFVLAASAAIALDRVGRVPEVVEVVLAKIAPLRSINSYGLFAVMTTDRREIALEGSADGVHWKRYEFSWKPGALDRRPRFATPHMPRLDWQMWFAALGRCERQGWLHAFLQRVLEGRPEVLELLALNPFPDRPPRYVRTPQARYRFAALADVWRGTWWRSEPLEDYCPELELRGGNLLRVGR